MIEVLALTWRLAVAGAAAVSVVLVVVSTARRAPGERPWLATLGTLLLLGSVLLALSPTASAAPIDGALNSAGYALVLTTYPNGRLAHRALAVPVAFYALLGLVPLLVGPQVVSSPIWMLVQGGEALLVAVAVHRYRRRLTTDERERTRWALLGAITTFAGMGALAAAVLGAGGRSIADAGPLADALASGVVAALPLCLTIGLVAPRILPVDDALRAIIAAVATAAPLALVVLAVDALSGSSVWWSATIAALAAIPLWPAAARLADRVVYGRRPSVDAAARMLAERLASIDGDEDVPRAVAAAVARSTGGERVVVTSEGLADAVAGPGAETEPDGGADADPRRSARRSPIRYGGRALGEIEVAPRRGETSLTRRDALVVDALADRAAPALHGAAAAAEAARAGAALLRAHEDERARLRRDLHDDLSPTLVGMGLTASGLARLLAREEHPLARTAEALAHDAHEAVALARAMTHGLEIAPEPGRGLMAIVRERMRSTDGFEIVVVERSPVPTLPSEIELAALRVVQEAVTNARRHAGARRCTVTLWCERDALRIVVSDDGAWVEAPPGASGEGAGLGLRSMRERVRAHGGELIVRPGGGETGTSVSAVIPVRTPLGGIGDAAEETVRADPEGAAGRRGGRTGGAT